MIIKKRKVHSLPRRQGSLDFESGFFKPTVDSFFVTEIPTYLPCGEGEHLFVLIQKKGMTTKDMLQLFKGKYHLKQTDVGYAGMKDRWATTEQWISLRGLKVGDLERFENENIKILDASLHQNKLRVGHLQGNQFRLHVKYNQDKDLEEIKSCLELLQEKGVPNYFGSQRFGKDGLNAEEGYLLLKKKKRIPSFWKRKFLLSSYQSQFFNDLLAFRLEEGLLDTCLEGDWLKKHDSGGQFLCENIKEEQLRSELFEVSPTGVLPGHHVRLAEGLPGEWEAALLEREEVTLKDFRSLGKIANGTRRFLRIPLLEPSILADSKAKTFWFTFTLPPGSYATIVLRELGIQNEATEN